MKSISLVCGKKEYGKLVVFSNLSLSFEKQKVTVLHGPSGCGKTTFLKCLSLLEPMQQGSVVLEGKEAFETELRKRVGIVFQDFYLWDNKKVVDNILEALVYVKKMKRNEALAKIQPILSDLQIDASLLEKYPPELSRGQRQRVALARTLAMDPDIILLDEPTASLDSALIDSVISLVHLLKQKGKTILVVTHDHSFAEKVGDVLIDFGKLAMNSTSDFVSKDC